MSVKIEVSDEVINADAITLCNPLAVKKAVVIPENPTNGEVMELLFGISLNDFKAIWGGGDITDEWWNASYKAESEVMNAKGNN